MAVVPAIFEELFFRGYIYSAIRSTASLRATLFGSALLFGLFHLVVTDSLAFERFLPSTFLGLVLAWVRSRTDSLFPGILLHACHNGLLMLVSYYEPQLTARGWGITEQQTNLPLTWLAAGAVAASIGALLLHFGARPNKENNVARRSAS